MKKSHGRVGANVTLSVLLCMAVLSAGCGDKSKEQPAAPAAAAPAVPAVVPGHLTEFKQEITSSQTALRMKPNSLTTIPVRVTNAGTQGWRNSGEFFTDLSYRWYEKDRMLIIEGERTKLPDRLTPGASVDLVATIKAPPQPGDYRLLVTMVQEGVAWFSERGATPLEIPVTVR